MKTEEKIVIPELLLQQFLFNELSPEKHIEIENMLHRNKAAETQLTELRKEAEDFSRSAFINKEIAAIKIKAKEKESFKNVIKFTGKIRYISAITAIAAALTFAVFTVSWNSILQRTNTAAYDLFETGTTRIKGLDASLKIYKKTKDGSQELLSGDEASKGDVLQLSLVAAGQNNVVVFSIDGNSIVTRHLRSPQGGSMMPGKSGEYFLPTAYELDDAPDYEIFYAVLSANPLSTVEINNIENLILKNTDLKETGVENASILQVKIIKK